MALQLTPFRFVVTDYFDAEGARAFRSVLHRTRTDTAVDFHDVVRTALEKLGARDGDEVAVMVSKTGRRPFGDRKMRLVGPHIYEREAEQEDVAE